MISYSKALTGLLAFFLLLPIISIAQAPANDVCENAIELTLNAGLITSDNFNTVTNGPEPNCGFGNIKDVWFSFEFTGEATTVFMQPLTLSGLRFAIYDACGGNETGCVTGNGGTSYNIDCSNFSVGQMVFIQAGDLSNGQGSFAIQVFTNSTIAGCTDNSACNYFPAANCEDGSCIYDVDDCGVCGGSNISGCMDSTKCNFNPSATCDDGSCVFIAPNDECSGAIHLSTDSPSNSFSANSAASCANGPDPSCGGSDIEDLWWKFTFDSHAIEIISTGTIGISTIRIAVYDDCGGAEIACSDPAPDISPSAARVFFDCDVLETGHTYYIQVGGQGNEVGFFDIQIIQRIPGCTNNQACNFDPDAACDDGSCEIPDACGLCGGTGTTPGCLDSTAFNFNPSADCPGVICVYGSDECQNAFEAPDNLGPISVDNSLSVIDGPNPSCGGSTQIRDLWFQFTYEGGLYHVYTLDGAVDTRLAVYESCGGVEIFCDDNSGDSGFDSELVLDCVDLIVGQTYFIQCGGVDDTAGQFQIQFDKIPFEECPITVNDICENAIPITPNFGPVETSNEFTLIDGPNPSCGGGNIKDVWFLFDYFGGDITITTTSGTLNDTRLALWEGNCTSLTEVACNDDANFGSNLISKLFFTCDELTPFQTYYIQAGGFVGLSGSFQIEVTNTATVEGCTDPEKCGYDPLATCDNGSCVFQYDHDLCSGALNIIPGDPEGFYGLEYSCEDESDPSCGGIGIVDLWWKFTYEFGAIEIICQAFENLSGVRIAVYDACGGEELACNDWDVFAAPTTASLFFECNELEVGHTYYIQAGGHDDQAGTLSLEVLLHNDSGCTATQACNYDSNAYCDDGSCTYENACGNCDGPAIFPGCTEPSALNFDSNADCDNGSCIYGSDECQNAHEAPDNVGAVLIDNSLSVIDGPNPSCGGATQIRDIWFKFTYEGGLYFISTLIGEVDTRLALYASCGGSEILCSDEDEIFGIYDAQIALDCNDLNIGQSYYVQCGGVDDTAGQIFIQFDKYANEECPITTNDICEDAMLLFSGQGPVETNNEFSINDFFPPDCGNAFPPNDVWFMFLYQGGDILISTTLGTLTDTWLALWEGNCPSGLSEVECVDDVSGVGFNAQLFFTCDELEIGETYYVQAGGYSSLTGTFQIELENTPTVHGCTFSSACNYDPDATCNDGSCVFDPPGCTDPAACNYTNLAECDNGSCIYSGCTYEFACNYDPTAGCDDNSCAFAGCTNSVAINYNPLAACDDGSCFIDSSTCQGDLNSDNQIGTVDLLIFLTVYGETCD